jgi:hypothetical protein
MDTISATGAPAAGPHRCRAFEASFTRFSDNAVAIDHCIFSKNGDFNTDEIFTFQIVEHNAR